MGCSGRVSDPEVVIGSSRRWWPAVVVAAAGLVVGLVMIGARGEQSTSPSTVPVTTNPPAVSTAVSTELPTVTPTNATVTGATLPVMPFGVPTGAVVYLTPESGAPTGLRAYDIDAGV